MKGIVLLFGIIIIIVSFVIITYRVEIEVSEYDPIWNRVVTRTVTVYPYQIVGAIVLLIGFVTVIVGVAIPEEKGITPLEEVEEDMGQVKLTNFTGEIKSKGMTCGTCLYFGNPIMCPFREKNSRTRYCMSYKSKTKTR